MAHTLLAYWRGLLINSGLARSSEASPRLLSEITLSHAKLSGAYLREADLSYADLRDANLLRADLRDANLLRADLSYADLNSAKLHDVNLDDADLSGADLSNAVIWTEEQLTATASLKGATMPNGQKYEDWLKSRGEENGGSS